MRRRFLVVVALVVLLLTGCAEDAPLDALEPDGPFARKADRLWDLTFALAVFVFIVVEGLIVYAVFRFRRRGDDDNPRQVHGNPRVEITLTILPALLLAFVAVPTVATVFELAEDPKDGLEITVVGHQWWWEYDYGELGVVTANELHIPTRRTVQLRLESADVIHSFWIPKLAGKKDVMPGRSNEMLLQADRPGIYGGNCAEFCGLSHANMRPSVVAHPPDEFEEWVASQRAAAVAPAEGSDAATGLQLFNAKGCAGCHTVDGVSQGKIGPNLTHLHARQTFAAGIFEMTDANLAAWLRDPPGEKPGAKMPNLGLNESEIADLVAYLRTLE
jgi:cytochrome c oxidase subunit 2